MTELCADPGFSRIQAVTEQREWGDGDCRYFQYPFPDLIDGLRSDLHPYLVPIANAWNERMQISARYPRTHLQFLEICRCAGRSLATSLLLEHGPNRRSLLH